MFWKKKKEAAGETSAAAKVGATAAAAVPEAAKAAVKAVKKLPPKVELANRVEQLKEDEEVVYLLSETFGGGLAVVKINPKYPQKGKKFALYSETLVDKQPSGKRQFLWDYKSGKDIASWILDRNGKPFESQA